MVPREPRKKAQKPPAVVEPDDDRPARRHGGSRAAADPPQEAAAAAPLTPAPEPVNGAPAAPEVLLSPDAPRQDGSPRPAPVTDAEWEAIFQRIVSLDTGAPGGASAGERAPLQPPSADLQALELRFGDLLDDDPAVQAVHLRSLADAAAYFGTDGHEGEIAGGGDSATATVVQSPPVALTEQEWRERFFQRGPLTGLLEGDDLLILTAPDVAGGVTSLRLHGAALPTVAAAALRQHVGGFDWRDHDDFVLLGIVLDWYLRGISLESRPRAVQDAVRALAQRHSALIERLAALLPPR